MFTDQTFLIPHLKKSDIKLYKALSAINTGLVTATSDITELQSTPAPTPFVPVVHQATVSYAITATAFNFVTFNAPVAGLFMIYGTFQIFFDILDSGNTITYNLVGGGSSILTGTLNQTVTASGQITFSLSAPYKAASGDLLALQIYKSGGTGATFVEGTLNTVQIA